MKNAVTILILFSSLSSVSTSASEKKFIVKGKEVSASEATLSSLRGETEVYKCSKVKAKASEKTGNISLRSPDSVSTSISDEQAGYDQASYDSCIDSSEAKSEDECLVLAQKSLDSKTSN